MELVVRPSLQRESWSLYWKETTNTETVCLEDLALTLGPDSTVSDLLVAVGQKLGWQPVSTLTRLEGFKAPWERVICRGRQLDPSTVLDPQQLGSSPLVVVRVQLLAEGWKIQDEYDISSSEDEE